MSAIGAFAGAATRPRTDSKFDELRFTKRLAPPRAQTGQGIQTGMPDARKAGARLLRIHGVEAGIGWHGQSEVEGGQAAAVGAGNQKASTQRAASGTPAAHVRVHVDQARTGPDVVPELMLAVEAA